MRSRSSRDTERDTCQSVQQEVQTGTGNSSHNLRRRCSHVIELWLRRSSLTQMFERSENLKVPRTLAAGGGWGTRARPWWLLRQSALIVGQPSSKLPWTQHLQTKSKSK